MKQVEVFKTNVREIHEAEMLITKLLKHFPGSKIDIDMEDCDKVLRVEGKDFAAKEVIGLVSENGFDCHMLE